MAKRYNWTPQKNFQQDLNGITENANFPEHLDKENYRPRTLIDVTLETIDPTPNVHTLFVQFNEKYFWNKLLPVQVRWSQRMTTCAGTCSFHPRNRECIIALSAPLLKLRPRKDLVETLLHEMIHGYLFLTNNNRDRDGHGPEFCKHMYRINRDAGTNITIYHSFHDEVRLYQQHWWRCDGPCQNRPPYYGTVRRAMNRAPGPSDFWYKTHQATCGGKFIKIREPENKSKTKTKESTKSPEQKNTMDRYITKSPPSSVPNSNNNCKCKGKKNKNNPPEGFVKLGTNTNNVYGFGTGGPTSSTTKSQSNGAIKKVKSPSNIKYSGVVGGNATGRSNLLDKYFSPPAKKPPAKKPESVNSNSVQCPVCNINISKDLIDYHIETCLINESDGNPPAKRSKPSLSNNSENTNANMNKDNLYDCPVCKRRFPIEMIDLHLDECLSKGNHNTTNTKPKDNKKTNDGLINNTNNSDASRSLHECPICSDFFTEDTIDQHVNACLGDDKTEKNDNKSKRNSIVDLTSTPMKDKTDRNNITCPTCYRSIKLVDYIVHVETCLAAERKKQNSDKDAIVILDDDIYKPGSSKQINKTNDKYKCLVCDEMISKSISLNEHLDVCVMTSYGDASVLDSSVEKLPEVLKENIDSEEEEEEEEKHLCPICMRMIKESLMAAHVDDCIKDIH